MPPRLSRIDSKWAKLGLLVSSVLACACSFAERKASGSAGEKRRTAALAEVRAATTEGAPPLFREGEPERALLDQDIDWEAGSVMRALGNMRRTLKHTEYSHGTRVDVQRGTYVFDCSSMVQWVLLRAAPVSAKSAAAGLGWRPLAVDYQRRIASVKPGKERAGWLRIASVEDAKPGDVVAWVKPKIIDSKNTGHVLFVVLPPVRVHGYVDAYLMRVMDATSLLHADDTRAGGSGVGLGTILLVTNPDTGAPRAYGWVGLQWRAFETAIAIGRPTR